MALADVSIDEEIGNDWKAIQEKYAVEPEPAAAAVEAISEPIIEEKPIDTRARDEAGKFVKAEKPAKESQKTPSPEASPEVAAAPAPGGEPAASASSSPASAPDRDINRAPSTWKPQVRNEWANLSPTIRAEIHRREADFQNGQAQLLPDARLGSEIKRATEPYRMLIESTYGTPDRAMSAFLQTAAALQMGSNSQKLQTIVGLSQQFGIDLSALSQPGSPQPQQQPFADPRIDQLLAHQRQQEEQRQANEQRQVEGVANSWISEKDAAGNPKRPYIGDVIQEMSMLIPQIKQTHPHLAHAQILEQAYDRAVWANPDTRAALQGAQQSELQAKATADNQARIAQAKRAASVNVPRRASTPTPAKPGSLEETLTSTARELGLIS